MRASKEMGEVPDNYVSYTLKNTKPLPPITLRTLHKELQYLSLTAITVPPIVSLIGAYYVPLQCKTAIWSIIYYFCTILAITAGYHRLWSHRCYNASSPLRLILALFGAGAVQGSIKRWSTGHRSHHRYTDTPLDPYNANEGFWWTHIGWMLVKPRIRPGVADVRDLKKDWVVRWQHSNYVSLLLTMAFLFPMVVAWIGWGDAMGGLVYAGFLRLVFVHHSTFCVNSLAHWLGETPFDDKHTPKDHTMTAFVTVGEGYHNFHHQVGLASTSLSPVLTSIPLLLFFLNPTKQFPTDYRNAIKWYQYDPTKWFIYLCSLFRLASNLRTFPSNEIKKGILTMQMKKLREVQSGIEWPAEINRGGDEANEGLEIWSWEKFQSTSLTRPLILISGYIHDVSFFLNANNPGGMDHPGGQHLINKFIGKDATTAFFGGVYEHSNAAHNLLAMKRVAILQGGHPHALDMKIRSKSSDLSTSTTSPESPASIPDDNLNDIDMDTINISRLIPPQHLKIVDYSDFAASLHYRRSQSSSAWGKTGYPIRTTPASVGGGEGWDAGYGSTTAVESDGNEGGHMGEGEGARL
ncbi:hypothetical protein D9758_004280 [Tetrapyrgos nigripes]|uniref:Cytochrome b5 heme-binding domain-containing protein n=1 Tax=Tetrapyrgos nigripes TaxID=182062 RepID=A0A8H5GUW6_9AGAR|nr:hypothetical protein D9758_004280 [Tetrapyrgos nigripes]